MSTLDMQLCSLCERVWRRRGLLAVLLFGSFAEGREDQFSDFDLLCLIDDDEGRMHRKEELLTERRVEMTAMSIETALSRFGPQFWRDNHILHGLCFGRAIHDPRKHLQTVQMRAREAWARGIGSHTTEQARPLRETLARLDAAALILAARASARIIIDRMDEIQMDRLMVATLLLAMRAQSLWAYPPWVLLHMSDERYLHFQRFCDTYKAATGIDKRSQLIHELAALADQALLTRS